MNANLIEEMTKWIIGNYALETKPLLAILFFDSFYYFHSRPLARCWDHLFTKTTGYPALTSSVHKYHCSRVLTSEEKAANILE